MLELRHGRNFAVLKYELGAAVSLQPLVSVWQKLCKNNL